MAYDPRWRNVEAWVISPPDLSAEEFTAGLGERFKDSTQIVVRVFYRGITFYNQSIYDDKFMIENPDYFKMIMDSIVESVDAELERWERESKFETPPTQGGGRAW